jgi:FtsP/CotA-like multicopper oxidase with cupredoxin domain
MTSRRIHQAMYLLVAALVLGTLPASAAIKVQCPGDTNGDAVINAPDPQHPNAKCMHLGAGDGFVTMADGHLQYIFGFSNLTGVLEANAMATGMLAANFAAPTITVNEGDEFYLNLSNVGMIMRPDLFDPHSVHWHGFPDASAIFDGVPDSSAVINMGSTFSYYYNVADPGTYMYHCHVEATEHMQMGMLGNLYVRPKQDGTSYTVGPKTFTKFAYNDGDGSTGYDRDYAIQMTSFDSFFHDEHLLVQPLPFYYMKDDYAMLNGRGYPDTVNPNPLSAPVDEFGDPVNGGVQSQPVSALITAAAGERVLVRLSNLSVTRFFTLGTAGVPMKVVGWNARQLRGPDPDGAGPAKGKDLYFDTNSVTLGGGESADVILDIPATATPGTKYFLYTTNLNYLSNREDDFGGMMTEIVIL